MADERILFSEPFEDAARLFRLAASRARSPQ